MNTKGLSYIEIIISVAVTAIIILVIGKLATTSNIINSLIDQTVKIRQSSDYTFQTLVSDIRSMIPSATGAYPIETASSTSFIFFSDTDRDGVVDRVRYALATSTLDRGTIKPTGNPLTYNTSNEIIVSNIYNVDVGQSSFAYFDENWTGSQIPLSSPINLLAIRVIQVTIAVKSSTSTENIVKFTNTIMPRNLKQN